MNQKENARRIITFDNPEKVVTACPVHRLAYNGCDHEGYEGGGHHLPVGSKWTDIWGTEWHREHDDVMGFPRGTPLSDLPNMLSEYVWPDPNDERLIGKLKTDKVGWDKENTFLVGSHRDTLWEKSYMLVGMENMMCFLYTEPEAVRELFHGIMDFHIGMAKNYLELGVEMVGMSDDLGTQHGLLMSPDTIKEFLVPEYKRLFDFYKQHGIIVNFHSCGHIEPVLDILMELGVDILNPLQSSANDLEHVRKITQGKMAMQGGISSDLLVKGPVADIRTEVEKRIQQLGKSGGYFCSPDQHMPWPEAHIKALNDAVDEFGEY